jgi:hypothetical protein
MVEVERRRGRDRRVQPRGGRRPDDRAGYAPLVFLVVADKSRLAFWEAALLERKFAVMPCHSPDSALEVCRALGPDVIVASASDLGQLRDRLPVRAGGPLIALVELVSTSNSVESVVQGIRRALRAPRTAS